MSRRERFVLALIRGIDWLETVGLYLKIRRNQIYVHGHTGVDGILVGVERVVWSRGQPVVHFRPFDPTQENYVIAITWSMPIARFDWEFQQLRYRGFGSWASDHNHLEMFEWGYLKPRGWDERRERQSA
jgi:hypothetical protein